MSRVNQERAKEDKGRQRGGLFEMLKRQRRRKGASLASEANEINLKSVEVIGF